MTQTQELFGPVDAQGLAGWNRLDRAEQLTPQIAQAF